MKIIGHRGCFYETENTIKSFLKAFELGADGIEVDIQSTLDKYLIISHDSNLKRLTEINFDIRKNSFNNLLKFKINEETIPLLIEVLELVKEKNKFIDIEVKNPEDINLVCELVSEFNYEEVIVSSFFHKELYKCKKNFKKIRFAYLYSHEPRNINDYLNEVDFIKPNINYLTLDYKKFSKRVIPWVVNEEKDITKVKNSDLFGVITDFPDKIRKFLSGEKISENIFINFFIKSIVKEESILNNNLLILVLKNIFQDFVIEKMKINGKIINLEKNYPLLWKLGDKLTVKIEKFDKNSRLTFTLKDIGFFEIEVNEIIKYLV